MTFARTFLTMVAMVALITGTTIATAPQSVKGTSVSRMKTITPTQATALNRARIRNLDELAAALSSDIMRILGVSERAAESLVYEAQAERSRLRAIYRAARSRYRASTTSTPSTSSDPQDEYAALIAPANECTILVRKACGQENQCADRAGCSASMYLLGIYNEATDKIEGAYSCIAALEDGIVFAECTQ